MGDKVTLGIHSNGGNGGFTAGHAWISVTRNGQTEYYGLWPDDHPHVQDNGAGSDIRVGMERGATATASRYYELTPEQAKNLEAELKKNVTWGYTHNCASWASETVSRVTGERISADTRVPAVETPNALIDSINKLERERATAPAQPLQPSEIKQESSSLGSLSGNGAPAQTNALASALAPNLTQPNHPDHAFYTSMRERLPADISDDTVAYAVQKAKHSGIENERQLDQAMAVDGNVYLTGKNAGFHASVAAGEPVPSIQDTSERLHARQSDDLAQTAAKQQEVAQRQPGFSMG